MQPLQSILCIWLFILFFSVYVTNIEAEANHLLFEIWIFPFRIRLVDQLGNARRENERKKQWKSTLKVNAISGFRMIIFRHTFNLCNAHELSVSWNQCQTAQFLFCFFFVLTETERVLFTESTFYVIHFIHLFQRFTFDFDSDNHGDK